MYFVLSGIGPRSLLSLRISAPPPTGLTRPCFGVFPGPACVNFLNIIEPRAACTYSIHRPSPTIDCQDVRIYSPPRIRRWAMRHSMTIIKFHLLFQCPPPHVPPWKRGGSSGIAAGMLSVACRLSHCLQAVSLAGFTYPNLRSARSAPRSFSRCQ